MTAPHLDAAWQAFRTVDFNWTLRLEDIWRDRVGDVPTLHQNARHELLGELERLQKRDDAASPLGQFLVGEAGSGKTHLLGALRREAVRAGFGFILVDMTDVSDFWETVAQGYLNSLQAPYRNGRAQYRFLLEKLLEKIPIKQAATIEAVQMLSRQKTEQLNKNIKGTLKLLGHLYPRETQTHQDTIRALISLNSDDFDIRNSGMAWLQSVELDDAVRRTFHFQKSREEPREVVRALSWIMSLAGPSVLAFDQLDPIVHQVSRQNVPEDIEEQNAARLIIDKIGNGLSALRDVTSKTLIVVSCLEPSYEVLTKEVLRSNLDRYHPPIRLRWERADLPSSVVNTLLLTARLTPHYEEAHFTPPYPTWPFLPRAMEGLRGESPRRFLQLCEAYRRRCIEAGVVEELQSFEAPVVNKPTPALNEFERYDREFQQLRGSVDLAALRDEKNEDDLLAPLYRTALLCLKYEHETEWGQDIVASVDQEFVGGRATKPLHGRLRLQFQNEGDREEHYCVRVLLRTQHSAYRTRLKAAMTQSGIDKKLKFRRLTIIRFTKPPGGADTAKSTKEFEALGGRFHCPSEDELRTLFALTQMANARLPQWSAWLADRQPAARLGLGQTLAPGSLLDPTHTKTAEIDSTMKPVVLPLTPVAAKTVAPVNTVVREPSPDIWLGNRLVGDSLKQAVYLPVPLLEKHTFVVASAGSGKTVLLKRLVEEAALAGVPSIVIDGANDLATLGETWPEAPASFSEAERHKAERYFANTEVVIWTPGVEKANPMRLNPLPDFAAVASDPEALEDSVEIAVDGLGELIATGTPTVRDKKISILRKVLYYFARQGGGDLEDLIALLREPPHEARLGIEREAKLARDLSDTLRVRRENNPLLRSSGAALDPANLFGDTTLGGRTRVSIVNLAGLNGIANQQQFLNQLSMTLFDWAKKNPAPPERALRGLFLLDEAKDYIPSRGGSVCKRSLMRCAAQLRKYHIGMVFATQSPKDLENTIIQNCSTQFYGKVSSPVAIETVQDLMRIKGGSGADISNLPTGVFYLHNADADFKTPTKIKVPLCLSHHRANPPSAEEIAALASRRLE